MGNIETRHSVERFSASKDPAHNELENVDGAIYGDDRDRKLWLETPSEASKKTDSRTQAWVKNDAGDCPDEARRAAKGGAAEKSIGAGL